ncbi:isoamyl alcohol oxidase [Aspergillus bertholletiae]|uniref:Isoamyl alcohol oxidase n=1 Tax=Aspergillus bertholletiae TaxID=1226010 RepID=A0A5N7AXH3_9EURO|nr:isoamyl alcohol oxidase [Aspergillus bertholletiae]
MLWSAFPLLFLGAQSVVAKCKCAPTDNCWPSLSAWDTLNSTVNGKLIHNQPLAESCYPGQDYNAQSCKDISNGWHNSSIIGLDPLGYSYPLFDTCPPVNTSAAKGQACDLGNAPVYTVNATEAEDVAAGIRFAKENNILLVIKNTGHDIVGRSQGYGSLMIWIKYIRNGLQYHENYSSPSGCRANWTGSAFTVGGGYVWREVYYAAADKGQLVVGGGDSTVGVIGGYLQGAGHGYSSHHFGLGTDQVLEMTVVLASGEIVIANACQHTDLFTALRGGGGGTYGVVISTTIKAYPTRPVLAHRLSVIPLNASLATLLNVSANIVSKYPILSDAGFSGYGTMGPGALLGQSSQVSALYGHKFGKMLPNNNASIAASIQQAKSVINKHLVQDLLPYNGSDFRITSEWTLYPSFKKYYAATGGQPTVGISNLLLTSRLFDKAALLNNEQKLEGMMRTLFSTHTNRTLSAKDTMLYLCLVGGGKVLHPEPYTSVHPGWRKAYLLSEVINVWSEDASVEEIKKVKDDLTFRKMDAMRALTPGMGNYLNEADRYDPSWKEDFWGENYGWLRSVKQRYDPDHIFWCYPCVGSEYWGEVTSEKGYGPLCQND